MDSDYKKRAEYWIPVLKRMEDSHLPRLDHKDCGELAEILEAFKDEKMFTIEEINNAYNDGGNSSEIGFVCYQDYLNEELNKARDEHEH